MAAVIPHSFLTKNMVYLVANRQLFGDWGNVPQNGMFQTDEETALNLESRGLAYRWRPPTGRTVKPLASPENRMLRVPETK